MWVNQVADALVTMQHLVTETIAQEPRPSMLMRWPPRSTLLLRGPGRNQQTAARSDAVMRKHHAATRRLIDRQDDYLRFTRDWRIPLNRLIPVLPVGRHAVEQGIVDFG